MLVRLAVCSTLVVLCAADCRPDKSDRAFSSAIIDEIVTNVSAQLKDPILSQIFHCTYPNTLDTTVHYNESADDTFIITGDINAMWLRDSTWQVDGYMQYANEDSHLKDMLKSLINRQVSSVLIDGYANAFNYKYDPNSGHQNDDRIPPMNGYIFEGKYELDSLCSVLHCSWRLFNITGDTDILSTKWEAAVQSIYEIMRYQQKSSIEEDVTDTLFYSFARETTVPTDTLLHEIGPPGIYTGLIKSAFRPSDDATRLPFLIPSNAFAVVSLRRTADIFATVFNNQTMAEQLTTLADEIDDAIRRYAIVSMSNHCNDDLESTNSFAFEIDGYGGRVFMDDGNVPSLLSLPYLGYVSLESETYINTRKRLLSSDSNPYFFKGSFGEGIGSPHTGQNGNIWPMSIIMRALTSDDDDEIMECLDILKGSTDNTFFMHESFFMNDPSQYTRSWFAWCNNLFGTLILKILDERPYLIT